MKPVIFGCEGLRLTASEKRFFSAIDPAGFILFARNCETPEQIKALTREMRDVTGRSDLAILIDQEGGRVARLGPPHWRKAPAARFFGEIYEKDKPVGERLTWLNSLLIADELRAIGINVDCLPVLDIPADGADPIIGDRAYGRNVGIVSALGKQAASGLIAGGVLPVIKHIPGHGRAKVDSHIGLPVSDAEWQSLSDHDFRPFRALSDSPFAMTAHMIYPAIDPENCATFSQIIIRDVIRKEIGFSGILMSDDLSMGALDGDFRARTEKALQAGCDLILHCNGKMTEMVEISAALGTASLDVTQKLALCLATAASTPLIDQGEVVAEYQSLIIKTA